MALNAVQLIEQGFRARELDVDPVDAPYSNKRERRMHQAWMVGWVLADREIMARRAVDEKRRAPHKLVLIRQA